MLYGIGDTVGKFTCHQRQGSSVVDYTIVSHSLFSRINLFYVHPLNLSLSDHCQLSFSLQTNAIYNRLAEKTQEQQCLVVQKENISYLWDTDSKYRFHAALQSKHIVQLIDEFNSKTFDTSKQSIDTASVMLTDIFTEAAGRSLRKHVKNKNTRKKQSD